MYACSAKVSPSVISVIHSAGVEVLDGDVTYRPKRDEMDIHKRAHYAELKIMGAMGMFDPLTPDKVYVFDYVTEDMIDYVLMHELGHLVSFRAKTGFHALAEQLGLNAPRESRPNISYSQFIDLRHLQVQEECIADCFAMGMLIRLGLNVELPLWHNRMENYRFRLRDERIQELNKIALSLANNIGSSGLVAA